MTSEKPKPLSAEVAARIMRAYIWPEEMSGAADYDIEKAKLLRKKIAATIDAQAATIRELEADCGELKEAAFDMQHGFKEQWDRAEAAEARIRELETEEPADTLAGLGQQLQDGKKLKFGTEERILAKLVEAWKAKAEAAEARIRAADRLAEATEEYMVAYDAWDLHRDNLTQNRLTDAANHLRYHALAAYQQSREVKS